MIIKNISLREIFATNSQKTLEVEIETFKGKVRSSVPIGTSKGKYEIKYLPTDAALKKFIMFKRFFSSQDFLDQEDVDNTIRLVDKSPDFRDLGGNLALAISSAFLKAFALEKGEEVFEFLSGTYDPKLPVPICNLAGGWHGESDIQEYEMVPIHQKSFLDNISRISSAYLKLGDTLKREDPNFVYGKNLESAWVTSLPLEKILKLMTKLASENLMKIGMDVAANNLWTKESYFYKTSKLVLTRSEQINYMETLGLENPLIYIEDPFHEDDLIAFATLTQHLKSKMIVGDDFYATNLERLKTGVANRATSGIIIKPNQVGTISDVSKVIQYAKKNNMATIFSHRSGETDDGLLDHLAVGFQSDYIKLVISGERTDKINEMIRIEEKIQNKKQ